MAPIPPPITGFRELGEKGFWLSGPMSSLLGWGDHFLLESLKGRLGNELGLQLLLSAPF